MTTRKSSTPTQIKESFDELFNSFSDEELLEQEARLLSFQFLSEIEIAMERQRMSKKQLAEKVNTSASYITQLFRGDRLPNFNILAKIQKALGLKFDVKGKEIPADNLKKKLDLADAKEDKLRLIKTMSKSHGTPDLRPHSQGSYYIPST